MELIDIERAIIKKYRVELFRPFIRAIDEYQLLQENDHIGVCISGGKDSLLLAKLFQEIQRHGKIAFKLSFLVMDPGFNKTHLDKLIENCNFLNIPIMIKQSNIFHVSQKMDPDHPCFLCAKMRRGFLYQFAQEQGCNKIALAHHLNDVIETTLLNVLYASNYKTMMPKLKSTNFKGMELIRPMVYIKEQDIIRMMKWSKIEAMNCGCRFSETNTNSKRQEIKQIIANLKKEFKDVEISIYRSAENINLNCVLGWSHNKQKHNFLEHYDDEA